MEHMAAGHPKCSSFAPRSTFPSRPPPPLWFILRSMFRSFDRAPYVWICLPFLFPAIVGERRAPFGPVNAYTPGRC